MQAMSRAACVAIIAAACFGTSPAWGRGVCTVIDGDTIRCGAERVRIMGLDAPEIRARCTAEYRLAVQARARLSVLIA